jgi:AGCS family alanine or glycine:cation symporter
LRELQQQLHSMVQEQFFWMWFIAFIGSASAFIESILAQIYKVKDKGEYRVGPAYYIEKGRGKKWYALIFAFAALLAMSVLGPGVQANSITAGLNNAFSIPPLTSGIVLVVVLGLIIFGGVKRIARWHNMLFRLWPLDMFLFR